MNKDSNGDSGISVKWNPYAMGEVKRQIMAEMKSIAESKDYRQGKGLESGTIKEFKGNDHWSLFVQLELFEYTMKRMDELFKNTFIPTIVAVKESQAKMSSIHVHMRELEESLVKKFTVRQDELLKSVKQDSIRLQRLKEDLDKMSAAFTKDAAETRTTVQTGAKLLRMASSKDLDDMKAAVSVFQQGQAEALERSLQGNTDEIKSALASHEVGFSTLTEKLERMRAERRDHDGATQENYQAISTAVEQLQSRTDAMSEQLEQAVSKLDALSQSQSGDIAKSIQDAQMKSAAELKNAIQALGRTVEERHQTTKAGVTDFVHSRIEDLEERLEHADAAAHADIKREIGELKVTLTSIRSDMELMKTLLSKMGR